MAASEAAGLPIKMKEKIREPIKIKEKDVLWFDDVNHNSTTKEHGVEYLESLGARSITTAVLHEKPMFSHSKADFVVRRTDAWIVYPWEHLGSHLHNRWEFFYEKMPVWMLREDGSIASYEQCLERARAIGFDGSELPNISDREFKKSLFANLQQRYGQMPWINGGKQIPESVLQKIF